MPRLVSKYRLGTSAFERKDDSEKIDPKRFVILSVEGDNTEPSYFKHLNRHLNGTLIEIEVLRHKHGDGYSDPPHVIELLEEYMDVRDGNIIPDAFLQKYSSEEIEAYLKDDSALTIERKEEIQSDLAIWGIDLEYRKYLKDFCSENDIFAVIIDRDIGSHSRELMVECKKLCDQKQFGFFVTTPCFEFWLLLHLCNPQDDFSEDELKGFFGNPKVSSKHTVVSKIVSEKAHHTKEISCKVFDQMYFPNISRAMERAESFATDFPELYDSIGSNLPQLIRELGIE